MEISEYLRLIKNRWVSILVLAGLGLAIAGVLTALEAPKYSAKTQLFVSVKSADSTADLMQGSSFSEKRVASYINLVSSPRVLELASRKLEAGVSVDSLKAGISASTPTGTVLLDIHATDTAPSRAAAIANATAESLVQVVQEVESGSIVRLSVVEQASVPQTPSSPNVPLRLAIGLVLGALIGLAAAVLRHLFDNRLRSTASVEKITQAPVLGRFASDAAVIKRPLITQQDPFSPRAESYRQLRTHLLYTNVDGGSQTVVVTSSLPGEGKTTTTVNLAIVFAESGARVLLVDADLRRPRVARALGLEGTIGLTSVLAGQVMLQDAIQHWGSAGELHVLASGQRVPNPSELLGSRRMHEVLRDMENHYDIILIDSPPILPVTDPAILAPLAGGVVLVANLDGRLKKEELARAIGNVQAVDGRLLGLVLNKADVKNGESSYYDYVPDIGDDFDDVPTRKASTGSRSKYAKRG